MADENIDDLIALTKLSRELQAGGFSDRPVEYGRAYRGCLSARFPADQDVNGRWGVRRRHLPVVAAALGLTPVLETPQPSRRRIAA
jgi:hypothetical protein